MVKSQSAPAYSFDTIYFEAVSPPPGYSVRLSFVSFATESGYDFMDVFLDPSSAAPYRTSFTLSTPPGSILSCSGASICAEYSSPIQGLYGTPILVQLVSDDSVAVTGITFTASITPCPAGSFCATRASSPITCPVNNYCPLASSAPILCACSGGCAATGLAAPNSCSATPSATASPTATLSGGVS